MHDKGNEYGTRPDNTTNQEVTAPHQNLNGSHHDEETQCGLPDSLENRPCHNELRAKRRNWTKTEILEIMWCYHYCKLNGNGNYLHIYNYWRQRNPNTRPYMDANKLQNQRRFIQQNNNITPEEVETIISKIRETQTHVDTQNSPAPNNTSAEDTEIPVSEPQLHQDIRALYATTLSTELTERDVLPKIYLNNKAKELIKEGNILINKVLQEKDQLNLKEINALVYATAKTVTTELIGKQKRPQMKTKEYLPPWQRRLENKIAALRKDLSILVCISENKMMKDRKQAQDVISKYKINNEEELMLTIEQSKQKLTATAQRLRRYRTRQNQYLQNKMFQSNTKMFYRKLRQDNILIEQHPSKTQLEEYWGNLFENSEEHDKNAAWLKKIRKTKPAQMGWTQIAPEEVQEMLKRAHNWKAPGPDLIPNFWWKQLVTTHNPIANIFNDILRNPTKHPEWLAEGKTFLLPKSKNTSEPKNYRPITCLNTIYKTLTGIIADRITKHVVNANIMPTEQKGCSRGSFGCKDQLLCSKAIIEDCQKYKKNLVLGWIDYQKAFDSVPHSWLIEALELIGTAKEVISFCKESIKTWRTTIHLKLPDSELQTRPMQIRKGIFQGDSLSPLLFCIAMAPLSRLINELKVGYKITNANRPISHLIYMDDLKLVCSSKAQIRRSLEAVKDFSDSIKMHFGLDKCAIATFKKGKMEQTENIILGREDTIKSLEPGEYYKYLGIKEGSNINHPELKENIKKEYLTRVRKVLACELNVKNKMTAIGALATPVMDYSFGIVEWNLDEIKQLDRKTRKLLTINGMLHPRADVERLYVKREHGGRGLRQLEAAYNNANYNLGYYLAKKAGSDYIVQAVYAHEQQKSAQRSLIKKAEKIATKVTGRNQQMVVDLQPLQVKKRIWEAIEQKWRDKPMHGQLHTQMKELSIDSKLSYAWLKEGKLKGETEGLLTAAQDQALKTRHIEYAIHHTRTDGKCRLCKTAEETVEHIMSSCSILAPQEYTDRHNNVCKALHFSISKYYECPLQTEKWYEHKPLHVTKSKDGKVTLLYDQQIITDRSIQANRPDLVLKTERLVYIIDVSIPADPNIIKKEAEKQLKYKSLMIEIQRMWNAKTVIIPVVIGVTGFVTKSFREHLQQIPGVHSPNHLQQVAILGTAHILRKVLT